MKPGPKRKSMEERFDSMVVKTDTCWLWGGENGVKRYGVISYGGRASKAVSAHRYSYLRYNGPIARGLVVRHKCDVMNCVNPEHLELGTNEDNVDDRNARGRSVGSGKARLDRKKRRGGNRKLMRAEIEKIKAEYATGEFSQAQLAHRWSVSQATISATIRGTHNCSTGKTDTRRTGNFKSKITEQQRQEIRDKYASGNYTQTALAVEYGVTQTRVSDIITGRDYKRSTSQHSESVTCP